MHDMNQFLCTFTFLLIFQSFDNLSLTLRNFLVNHSKYILDNI